MSTALSISQSHQITYMPQQASSDAQLISLWLHGKAERTQRVYAADAESLFAHAGKQLQQLTLGDLQSFADTFADAKDKGKRSISAIKSLLSFGHKLGYLPFNVGAALKTPKLKDTLAERILSEQEVLTMIALTKKQRDRVLLTILYASAGRVSEVCALSWRDVQPNGESGQVTLFGKNDETRAVKLSKATYAELLKLKGKALPTDAVFVSQKGGHLDASQVLRLVRAAAVRAGISGNVSPHWLRHSHASHSLERGASIALVRDTLGHSSLAITSRYTHAKPGDSSALHLAI